MITVLPPEFRTNMHAEKKHRELGPIIDRDIATESTSAEKVELPPPELALPINSVQLWDNAMTTNDAIRSPLD